METARDFGIVNGVTSSVRNLNFISSVSFSSKKLQLSSEQVLGAQLVASYIGNTLVRLNEAENPSGAVQPLTEREKECLRWVGHGKTSWEVSKILAMSERTVLFHLSNIQEKLQTCSRAHSVAKSSMLGLLDGDLFAYDPFDPKSSE